MPKYCQGNGRQREKILTQGQSTNKVNIWLKVLCQSSEVTLQGVKEGSSIREKDKHPASQRISAQNSPQ